MDDAPVPELQAVLAERDAWAQLLFESERRAAELVVTRQTLSDALVTLEARVRHVAGSDVAAARRARDHALAERDAALAERDQARAGQLEAEARLQRITASTSWRLTAPLRHALIVLLGRERDGP